MPRKSKYTRSEIMDHRKQARHRHYRKVKLTIFEYYGKFCACCGESRVEFLTIDHINGGGKSHRKQLKTRGGYGFYTWLMNHGFPDGYRTLCFNCNLSLGAYGYCPHGNVSRGAGQVLEPKEPELPLFVFKGGF